MRILKRLFGKETADAPTPDEQQKTTTRQFETLRDSGVRAMQIGELKLAIPYFEQALTLRPDDRQTQAYMAEAQLRAQDYAAALPYLQKLAPQETDGIELHLLLAQAQGKTGDFAAMQATMQPLLDEQVSSAEGDTEQTDARVPYMTAVAAHGLADNFTAIALLTQVLQTHSDYNAARRLRARILCEMGQWHEALADTTILASAEPDEESQILHAQALAQAGTAEAAEAAYRRVLETNPFNSEAYAALCHLYETTARLDKALAVCDEALSLLPTAAEIYKLRGGVKHRLGDEAGATDDLKRSLELAPEQAQSIDGEFTNLENRLADRYRRFNPYQF